MSQFNQIQKQIAKEADAREIRCVEIGHSILNSFIKHNISLKTSEFKDVMKEYKPVFEDVVNEGKEKDWLINDILFSIKLFMRLTENLKNIFELSLEENKEKALGKLAGKEIRKLTVNDVDKILKD